eukprot:scaffold70797_cov24-Tisochrysis_lutea.AAC.1
MQMSDVVEADGATRGQYHEQEAPEEAPLPMGYDHMLTEFEKLCVLRCLRVDRITVSTAQHACQHSFASISCVHCAALDVRADAGPAVQRCQVGPWEAARLTVTAFSGRTGHVLLDAAAPRKALPSLLGFATVHYCHELEFQE